MKSMLTLQIEDIKIIFTLINRVADPHSFHPDPVLDPAF
jgi:hypothetical protein